MEELDADLLLPSPSFLSLGRRCDPDDVLDADFEIDILHSISPICSHLLSFRDLDDPRRELDPYVLLDPEETRECPEDEEIGVLAEVDHDYLELGSELGFETSRGASTSDLGSGSEGGCAKDAILEDVDLALHWNCLRIDEERRDLYEEFEWEEVIGAALDREDDSGLGGERADALEEIGAAESESDDLGRRNVGWEVLLAMNGVERNLSPEHEDVGEEQDDVYVYTSDYDVLFGQFLDHEVSGKGAPPASRSVVENLLSALLAESVAAGTSTLCAICRDELSPQESIKQLPCLHHYHGDCILPWLAVRNTCPVCRYELPTNAAEYEDWKKQRAVREGVGCQCSSCSSRTRFFSDEKQLPVKAPRLFGRRVTFNFRRDSSGGTGGSKVFHEDHEPWKKGILDPGSDLMLKWNRIFLVACLVALFVDPFYFYLPKVENAGKIFACVKLSPNLSTILTVFRSIADMFYILHIVIKFRTAYTAPSSRVFGRGELVMDRRKIAKRYLQTDFFIDLFASLPLPQIVILIIIPAIKRTSNADHSNNALALIVLLQYFPRLYLIIPLMSQIVSTTGVVMKTAWAGAGYNLCLYMLASHVLGASWYLLSVDRQSTCWKSYCADLNDGCHKRFFDCDHVNDPDRITWAKNTSVFSSCNATDSSIAFQYGIFESALTKEAVSADFMKKYLYCLWWGLQQLSSYGQNLSTSTYIGETSFAILIAVVGLVLFAHLIGNMQTYLQSLTVRLEEWRLKRRDTEEWMRHRQLPPELRRRVRKFLQYKWFATRGVDEDAILRSLPSDLRRDIQRHLCLDLVRRVPFFAQMDEPLLDAICERLMSCLSTEGTFIVREGDPVTEMLFIIRGRLESSTTNGGRTGFFNSTILGPGDFCGEELLAWALHPKNTVNLPSSTQTVRALVEVEAFVLRAEDLRFVANQFRRLHSKRFQHTFRFYSHQYRTRAACFIQAAWHRYKRRKIVKELSTQVSFASRCDEQEEHGDPKDSSTARNISAMAIASKLSTSTFRKPDEPDFSSDMF